MPPTEQGWPIFKLWQKYEDIAMHFNDFLIMLRTQALGAIAELTTIRLFYILVARTLLGGFIFSFYQTLV